MADGPIVFCLPYLAFLFLLLPGFYCFTSGFASSLLIALVRCHLKHVRHNVFAQCLLLLSCTTLLVLTSVCWVRLCCRPQTVPFLVRIWIRGASMDQSRPWRFTRCWKRQGQLQGPCILSSELTLSNLWALYLVDIYIYIYLSLSLLRASGEACWHMGIYHI